MFDKFEDLEIIQTFLVTWEEVSCMWKDELNTFQTIFNMSGFGPVSELIHVYALWLLVSAALLISETSCRICP